MRVCRRLHLGFLLGFSGPASFEVPAPLSRSRRVHARRATTPVCVWIFVRANSQQALLRAYVLPVPQWY